MKKLEELTPTEFKKLKEVYQMNDIQKNNDLIRNFMGLIYHEVVEIDYSDCGGLYTRTSVYSSTPILVEDQFYLKEEWKPAPDTIFGNLKYDSSLDWLLPVITKIESLGYRNSITYRQSGDSFFHEMLFYDKDYDYLSIVAETYAPAIGEEQSIAIEWIDNAEKKTKLEAVYRAVINFIKFYNLKQSIHLNE